MLKLALENARLDTPNELLGYKFVQEWRSSRLSSPAKRGLHAWSLALSWCEAVPSAPATEDAESIEKRRRIIDREETAAL